MNILITGVSGYIASRIADRLWTKGHEIVGLDIRRSGHDSAGRRERFRFFLADLTDARSFPADLRSAEVLVHCAARGQRRSGAISPESVLRVNREGTRNILLSLDPQRLRQVVFLSTVSVYGASSAADEATPPEPLDTYGKSKLAAEGEIREFSRTRSIPHTIFRLAPVYGRSSLLNLSRRACLPGRLAFYRIGSGRQRTSLCSIHNVVEVVDDCVGGEKYFNETVILKDREDYSALEIIEALRVQFSAARQPVIRIPRALPEITLGALGLVLPAWAKTCRSRFDRIARGAVFSGRKIDSLKIPLGWDLRETLRVPEGQPF